jgi:hypothetical protein
MFSIKMEAPDKDDDNDNGEGDLLEPVVSLEEGPEQDSPEAKKAKKRPLNSRLAFCSNDLVKLG